jgi:CRP/FNR family transcriptional regulator, dissimilatory nitrate respiration regulator
MNYSVLSESPLFKGLTEIHIEEILKETPHRIRKFKNDTLISQSGEQVSSLMLVICGVVKGEMVDYAGKVIKIEDIPAPGALASAFIFGSSNRFPVNVVAKSEVEILMIEKSDFLRLIMRNDTVLVNFLNMISNRSQFLSEKIKFLNFKTIKSKLAHYLLMKAGKERNTFVLDVTQGELADFFGVARPSIARTLGEIEGEGFIEAKAKSIRIKDKKGLANLTAE